MWPFKRKKKLSLSDQDELAKAIKNLGSTRTPRMLCTRNDSCVCRDCPKIMTCGAELMARNAGCQEPIITCSYKSQLTTGKVSDFADMVATIKTKKLLRDFTPEEQDKLAKSMRAEEKKNGKKEGEPDPVTNGDGPWVTG